MEEHHNNNQSASKHASETVKSSADVNHITSADSVPLSFAQQQIWYAQIAAGDTPIFNLMATYRIPMAIDAAIFCEAVNRSVTDSDVLQTVFEEISPVDIRQRRELSVRGDCTTLELSESQLDTWCYEQGRKTLDVTRRCFHFQLLRFSESSYAFFFNVHHLIADGGILPLLWRQISHHYEHIKGLRNEAPPRFPLYHQHVLEQQTSVDTEFRQQALAFWNERANQHTAQANFYGLDAKPDYRMGRHYWAVEPSLCEKINAAIKVEPYASRSAGLSLFILFATAMMVTAWKTQGETQQRLGFPSRSRRDKAMSEALGIFISMGFLDIEFLSDDTAASVAPRIQQQMRDAIEHLDSSVYSARITRAFTSSLNVLIAPVQEMMGTPIKTELPYNGFSDSGSLLDVHVLDLTGQGNYTFLIDTADAVFNERDKHRYIGHFTKVLTALLDEPKQTLASIDLLTSEQRTDLLSSLRGSPSSLLPQQRLHAQFETIAREQPSAVALLTGSSSITFKDLDDKATQLQHYLQSKGVGSNHLVATCFERSVAGFVAVLAVLKAESVFVPIDPSYPEERIRLMLSESNASLVLCADTTKALACLNEYPVVCLDERGGERGDLLEHGHTLEHIKSSTRPVQSSPLISDAAQHPAYVLFTSGSSGVPKGVVGTHEATLNRLQWMWREYPFADDAVCCHKTSLSFVDSIWELFGPLLAGVPSVILNDEVVADIFQFTHALEKSRVTRLVIVPTLLSVLLDSDANIGETLSSLKLVVVSGEKLSAELADRFQQRLPDARLLNLYGSTEVSADVTAFEIGGKAADFNHSNTKRSSIPIGSPIDGIHILLLDKHQNLVPQGTPGEICVAGLGLSAGYLNPTAEQAAKFFQSPYVDSLVFRTGDLARLNDDGHLEYLGRQDSQVKRNGRRIEIAEIEHHMQAQLGVARCAVGVNRAGSLFGCFEPNNASPSEPNELLVSLQSVLPPYMVPDILFSVNALPRLPNGKTDAQQIALDSEDHDKTLRSRFEPLNAMESKLLAIWQQVLLVETLDLTADFFDLGGNSVAAMRIVVAARQQGLDVALDDIFVNGTLRGIAARCGELPNLENGSATTNSNSKDKNLAHLPSLSSSTMINNQRSATMTSQTLIRSHAESPEEENLSDIFNSVFPDRSIDFDADFFQAGGNSISAMQLMVAAKKHGFSLALRDIVESTSLAAVARLLQPIQSVDNTISQALLTEPNDQLNAQLIAQLNALGHSVSDTQVDYYPLSAPQRGILFHLLMLGLDTPLYVTQGRADLHGAINPELFQLAWQRLIERHDAMRSVVLHEDLLEPVQVVLTDAKVNWRFEDLSTLSADEQKNRQHQIAADSVKIPIALHQAPLKRVILIKHSDTQFHVIIDFHHILFDGWSAASFTEELATVYQALRDEQPAVLPEPGQFRDHVIAIRNIDSERVVKFWRSKLAGFSTPTLISTQKTQSRHFATGNHRLLIDVDTTEQLNQLAVQCRVTVNTIIQSAWALLLARRHHTEDVLYGFAVSGRSSGISNYHNTIGMFVNSLPMRADCKGSDEIKHYFQRMQSELLALIEFEHSSLTDVLSASDVDAQSILFDSLLVFQNVPQATEDETAPFRVRNRHNHENSHIPLTIEVFPEEALRILFLYIPTYCDHEFIHRIGQQFTDILQSFISLGANALVADVARDTQEQTLQALQGFNDTAFAYNKTQPFTHHIWHHASQTPEKTAVRLLDDSLSYQDLTQQVDCVAAELLEQGVKPGFVVGVFAERSLNLLISMLAIVRSGAAYVPIDPEYPAHRVAHIMQDSQLSHLLCHSSLRPSSESMLAIAWDSPKCVLVDEVLQRRDYQPDRVPPLVVNEVVDEAIGDAVGDNDLAYMIYTSGSTGVPKGVKVSHKNVSNFLMSMQQTPGFVASDRLLAMTTVSFDISVLELFLPLVCGGSLDIAPQPMLYDAFQLKAYLESTPISVMQATPTTWRLLLASGWQGNQTLTCLVGGEAFPADLATELLPHVKAVWNMYGPTETTVWSSCTQVIDPHATITIGQPIGNTQMVVLEPDGALCPMNKPGELCILGDGVSLGYHNRDALNQQKFIPVPSFLRDVWNGKSAINGAPAMAKDTTDKSLEPRLFKTGDLARWLDTGELECLGRMDRQIKLHGHRIELEEIESVLNAIDGVVHCVVEPLKSSLAERLVAYVVINQNSLSNSESLTKESSSFETNLRAEVRASLPEYMVPAAFVAMETIPRLPNGKVDRTSLPNPFADTDVVASDAVTLQAESDDAVAPENAPSGDMETQLHEVFCEVLGKSPMSVNSNFFDVGGNSLIAMRIVAACAANGLEVQIPQLFQLATIRRIARVCQILPAAESNQAATAPLASSTAAAPTAVPLHEDEDKLRIMALLSGKTV